MENTILLNEEQIQILQGYLDREDFHPDYNQIETLWTRTVDFGNNYAVDIDIVNAEGPYINAVLFYEGCEVHTLDPTWNIINTFKFDTEEEDGTKLEFTVTIREESNTEKFMKEIP